MKIDSRKQLLAAQDIVFEVAAELRALAYLFETQGTKANQIAEIDMDQISDGIGRILKHQVRRLHRAHTVLEQT